MRLINWFKCKLWLHDYYHIKRLSEVSQKVGCKNCGRCFAVNHSLRAVIPWDLEIESLYANRFMER